MLDSISGYRLALRGDDLVRDLHGLCNYLKNMGVTVLLVHEVENIGGDFRATELGISYLADNIVFLRYMELRDEASTEMRKAIGILKKRATDFEKSPREIKITRYGLQVGGPITGLSGIVSSVPVRVVPPSHKDEGWPTDPESWPSTAILATFSSWPGCSIGRVIASRAPPAWTSWIRRWAPAAVRRVWPWSTSPASVRPSGSAAISSARAVCLCWSSRLRTALLSSARAVPTARWTSWSSRWPRSSWSAASAE
jgi:hypothetical protein